MSNGECYGTGLLPGRLRNGDPVHGPLRVPQRDEGRARRVSMPLGLNKENSRNPKGTEEGNA